MCISIYTDKSHLYCLYIQLDNFDLNYLYFTGKIFFLFIIFPKYFTDISQKKT